MKVLDSKTAPPSEELEYNQCQEAVRKLNEYLNKELQPDEEERLHTHLSQCRECFSRFSFEDTLLKTIRDRVDQVRAPGYLREKILGLIGR
jgi:anti-sigma factor (TIGR02949 family)